MGGGGVERSLSRTAWTRNSRSIVSDLIRSIMPANRYPMIDHVVLFGEVSDAVILREGDPSIHLRRNGLGY